MMFKYVVDFELQVLEKWGKKKNISMITMIYIFIFYIGVEILLLLLELRK